MLSGGYKQSGEGTGFKAGTNGSPSANNNKKWATAETVTHFLNSRDEKI